jgi:hypothetical protein
MRQTRQPWLFSGPADCILILATAFAVTLLVETFPRFFAASNEVSPWNWLLLVVGIDVAHVYATLYRTYMDPEASRKYRALLIGIPFGCWIAGVLLYSSGRLTFWRVLAYLAVFHFVRQQYGFLRLYARKETQSAWGRRLDAAAIYLATLYPLVYWHTHPRSFQWFLPGDFFAFHAPWLERAALAVYGMVLVLYVVKEFRSAALNLPKQLVLAGTALSWYTGIVKYDGDLTFTITNVVAHGIPYMALIWFYQRKQTPRAATQEASRYRKRWFRPTMIPVYVGLLLLLAYVEEGLWDVILWRDHTQFFAWLAFIPQVGDRSLLALLVPLLAVPQATHYVLDGFIWRVREIET